MIRADRDRLIERYMNGQMTQAEEEAFFINAAVNPELRQELKAHRLVETAVRKERDGLTNGLTTGHAALRNRVAATLASASPAPVMEPAAAQGGMLVERVLGSVAAHPSVTAIIVGILAIGVVVLQPWESTETIPVDIRPTPVQTAPPLTPQSTTPPAMQQRGGEAGESIQSHTATPPAGGALTQPVEVGNAARNAPVSETSTTTNRSAEKLANQKETAAHGGSQTTAVAASSSPPPTAAAKPDSIKIGISIDVKSPTKPQ